MNPPSVLSLSSVFLILSELLGAVSLTQVCVSLVSVLFLQINNNKTEMESFVCRVEIEVMWHKDNRLSSRIRIGMVNRKRKIGELTACGGRFNSNNFHGDGRECGYDTASNDNIRVKMF